jgi:AcrR family transcriptional regulator
MASATEQGFTARIVNGRAKKAGCGELMTRTATTRRMGPVGSANWHLMLDAAEATLLEEGYSALTSRRIAERVDVKQRLIYYYFQTMDELIVETFRRMAIRELERMRNTLLTEMPLRELWDVCINTTDSRVTSEFMALAHRNESLRLEVVSFVEESRAIQVQAIHNSLARTNTAPPLDPNGLALLATGVALAMTRESAIGVRSGHDAIMEMIGNFLNTVETQTN